MQPAPSPKSKSAAPIEPVLTENVAYIGLRARDGIVGAYAIVDEADATWVNQWRWTLSRGYAYRAKIVNGKRCTVSLHREILGLTPGDGFEGDHINRNRLDCRRSNLRRLPKGANSQNQTGRSATSAHRGVTWDRHYGKWRAQIKVNGKGINLGRFADENDAAEAAKQARARWLPYSVD